jgi:hypothetical protein
MNERSYKKAPGIYDVLGDVLKFWGEDGLSLMSQLLKTYAKLVNGPRFSLRLQ